MNKVSNMHEGTLLDKDTSAQMFFFVQGVTFAQKLIFAQE